MSKVLVDFSTLWGQRKLLGVCAVLSAGMVSACGATASSSSAGSTPGTEETWWSPAGVPLPRVGAANPAAGVSFLPESTATDSAPEDAGTPNGAEANGTEPHAGLESNAGLEGAVAGEAGAGTHTARPPRPAAPRPAPARPTPPTPGPEPADPAGSNGRLPVSGRGEQFVPNVAPEDLVPPPLPKAEDIYIPLPEPPARLPKAEEVYIPLPELPALRR